MPIPLRADPVRESHDAGQTQRLRHEGVRWRVLDVVQWLSGTFKVSVSKQTISRELRNMGNLQAASPSTSRCPSNPRGGGF